MNMITFLVVYKYDNFSSSEWIGGSGEKYLYMKNLYLHKMTRWLL